MCRCGYGRGLGLRCAGGCSHSQRTGAGHLYEISSAYVFLVFHLFLVFNVYLKSVDVDCAERA